MYDFEFGSRTAKGGFANEKAICEKFNNWKNDEDAKLWLKIMGYDPDKIDYVKAIQIPTRIKKADIGRFGFSEEDYEELMRFKKTDVQVQVRLIIQINNALKVENLSLKKANSDADYNQVDKRWVDSYKEMRHFDDEIAGQTREDNCGQKSILLGQKELGDQGFSGLKSTRWVYLTER